MERKALRTAAAMLACISLALAFALAGCSGDKSISGSVSEVIEQAQGFEKDAPCTATVTGTRDDEMSGGAIVALSDEGGYVWCEFPDEDAANEAKGSQVTVKGELYGLMTGEDTIWLKNCAVQG